MPRINQTIIKEIHELLNTKQFTVADFDVKFPDEGTSYVQILFRHDSKYFFAIKEEIVSGTGIAALAIAIERKPKPHTYESPGDFKSTQVRVHDDFVSAVSRIREWCINLNSELRARTPALNDQGNMRQQLEELLQKLTIEDPESNFSVEQLNQLSENLDALSKKFVDLEKAHSITKAQLADAVSDIERIKDNAANLSRGLWAKLAKNRIVSLMVKIATSPEGRKFALEAAEKIFLGHGSNKP